MATVNRGDFVLGLQPDDRMPNDYLRMVARVFAAYREVPLEMSIVAYIDGYHLTLDSVVNNIVTIGITHGTAFVDDQFVGFTESSELVINGDELVVDVEYSIVLYYQWINIMPPQEPTYNIVRTDRIDPEHMLELGKLYKRSDGSYDLIDSKIPWWKQMMLMLTGDTEVDGPELLPYIPYIKENETMDIGWALDFHHDVGNGVDYNVRLRTDRSDDNNLFINNYRILTTYDFDTDNQRIIYYLGQFVSAPATRNDGTPLQEGDVYYDRMEHKYFYWKVNVWSEIGSGSGSGGGAAILSNCEFIATSGQTVFNCNYNPDFVYVALGGVTLSSTEYIAANGTTVELLIPAQGGEVIQIYSVIEVPVNSLSLNDLSDVEITSVQQDQIIAWDNISGQWINRTANFGGGGGGSGFGMTSKCEFIATAGQTNFICDYDPNFVMVSVSGIDLANTEFTATNGTDLILSNPAVAGDIVIIRSIYTIGKVEITSPTNEQVLIYNSTTDTWENGDQTGGSGSSGIQEFNFDSSSGQTVFVLNNVVGTRATVFVDGVKIRNTEYVLTDDGTDTTITFNQGMAENSWISVEI